MTPEEPEGDLPALRLGAVALVALLGTWALLANGDSWATGVGGSVLFVSGACAGPILAGLLCSWGRLLPRIVWIGGATYAGFSALGAFGYISLRYSADINPAGRLVAALFAAGGVVALGLVAVACAAWSVGAWNERSPSPGKGS